MLTTMAHGGSVIVYAEITVRTKFSTEYSTGCWYCPIVLGLLAVSVVDPLRRWVQSFSVMPAWYYVTKICLLQRYDNVCTDVASYRVSQLSVMKLTC